jgi:hypothetical protein
MERRSEFIVQVDQVTALKGANLVCFRCRSGFTPGQTGAPEEINVGTCQVQSRKVTCTSAFINCCHDPKQISNLIN